MPVKREMPLLLFIQCVCPEYVIQRAGTGQCGNSQDDGKDNKYQSCDLAYEKIENNQQYCQNQSDRPVCFTDVHFHHSITLVGIRF